MIIKLIQPKMLSRPMDTSLKTHMAPSLALLTIANVISSEHQVIIENENIESIDFNAYVDIVGITVTVDTMNRAVEIAEIFQKRNIKVIAGGIHITSNPENCTSYFDSICIGIAETTWPEIIADVKENKLKPVYSDNGFIKASDIIAPKYDIINHSKYLYTNVISTSRGCPYQCDFCYNSCRQLQNSYVNRNINDVLQDITLLNKKHIMFIDDNFIGNPEWTKDFLIAIKPLCLKWNAAVSANIVHMPELLDLMKETGCESLFIGFESLNDNSIKDVSKHQNNIMQYEQLVYELHKREIMINASFVFGLDGDNPSTFQATLDWIIKNKIETITSHILTPYPGTNLYERFIKQNRIIDFDLSHYNTASVVFEPKNMTKEQLYHGYLWIYKEIYSLRNIIKRIPHSKHQILPYLAFNLFYRKYGNFTEKIANLISFNRIGKLGEMMAYKIK